jgi:peroxiredoxin
MSLLDLQLHPTPARSTSIHAQIDNYSQTQLLELRGKIDQKLTGIKLAETNVVTELLVNYKKAQALQDGATEDKSAPLNQRAQVQNSLATILASIAKLQAKAYDSEQNKRMETALIRVLKDFPDIREKFFEHYTAAVVQDFSEAGLDE